MYLRVPIRLILKEGKGVRPASLVPILPPPPPKPHFCSGMVPSHFGGKLEGEQSVPKYRRGTSSPSRMWRIFGLRVVHQ